MQLEHLFVLHGAQIGTVSLKSAITHFSNVWSDYCAFNPFAVLVRRTGGEEQILWLDSREMEGFPVTLSVPKITQKKNIATRLKRVLQY